MAFLVALSVLKTLSTVCGCTDTGTFQTCQKRDASNGTLEEIVGRRYEELAVKGTGEVKCSGTEEE